MLVQGFQKMTLLDFPGKLACTVFTGGCNFRCPFCHNASLVLTPNCNSITEQEVIDYLVKRQGIIDGICITGGEPLMQNDIADFIFKVKKLGLSVKLDTNGSFPDLLIKLVNNGCIDYVAMDIKNAPDKYALSVGKESYDISAVNKSVNFLLKNTVPYEFRTTVVRELHRKEDFNEIGKWIRNSERYYLQNFKDSGNILVSGMHSCTYDELSVFADTIRPFVKNVEIRGI